MGKYEKKLKEKFKTKSERDKIKDIAAREFKSVKELSMAVRYIEVFSQLMKTKQFAQWMQTHIEIHDQVDKETQSVKTFVMYKDGDEQNIVRCPNCNTSFDANVEEPKIQLASKIPEPS